MAQHRQRNFADHGNGCRLHEFRDIRSDERGSQERVTVRVDHELSLRVEAVAENRQLREVSRVERVPCRHIESRCTRRSFGIADLHHLRICEDDLFECTLRQGVGERLVR